MTHKARIGSISHGTLRTPDLVNAFAWELDYLGARPLLTAKAFAWIEEGSEIGDGDEWDERGAYILQELFEALEEQAPPYCYFGALEGDGSDFGFWPCLEQIEELPRVQDSDEAKALGEDAAFVNDHGNVTVYGGDGSTILEIV